MRATLAIMMMTTMMKMTSCIGVASPFFILASLYFFLFESLHCYVHILRSLSSRAFPPVIWFRASPSLLCHLYHCHSIHDNVSR